MSKAALPDDTRENKRLKVADVLIILAIMLVYSAIAFTNLGNRSSPQTFMEFQSGTTETIELSEPVELKGVDVFSGLSVGAYEISVSADGDIYYGVAGFSQDYTRIFKWSEIEFEKPMDAVRFIRISCTSGNPRLGALIPVTDSTVTLSPSLLTDKDVQFDKSYMANAYFDEIYHARTAYEHIEGVKPYEITHPPLGKIIIGLGIMLFGLTPFGWRFSGTLAGVLMLPVMYIFAKKLYGGKKVPFAVTAVFAFDFMHFVQTRIATIDSYAVLFILLMYLFMYLFVSDESDHPTLMLFLCGLSFGIGAACKWTCLYAGAGLAIIWYVSWLFRLSKTGLSAFFKNCLQCVLFFVIIPVLIYYCSYYPYGKANGLSGFGMFFDKSYLKTVLSNQSYMLNYHKGVTSTHPYSSVWYQWIFNIRPILYYLEYNGAYRSSFGAFLNPVLCWGGLLSLFVLIYMAIFRRDKKACFILLGYLAQLVPWMFVSRVVFEYHYFPSSVFLCLSLGYVFKLMVECKCEYERIFSFVVVNALAFILFYPALSGMWVVNKTASSLLGWLPTWPF